MLLGADVGGGHFSDHQLFFELIGVRARRGAGRVFAPAHWAVSH